MDWVALLSKIFELCIIPLLGYLTVYAIQYIKVQSQKLQATTGNALYNKYIGMVEQTIISCVVATNQTYVNALKDKNAFTAEAQKEAFEKTYQAVLAILSVEAKDYLESAMGDFEAYLKNKIEAEVNRNK